LWCRLRIAKKKRPLVRAASVPHQRPEQPLRVDWFTVYSKASNLSRSRHLWNQLNSLPTSC
jgi:hypothetical protein